MGPTYRNRSGFPGLPCVALAAAALWGCGQAKSHASGPVAQDNVIRVELPASPARAFDLTKEALTVAVVEGTTQNPRWQPTVAILSTRYMRRRNGPVVTDVLVIAAVGRQVSDTLEPKVLVEISMWTVETPVGRGQFGASASQAGMVTRPRPLSRREATDWVNGENVAQFLVDNGAKRIP